MIIIPQYERLLIYNDNGDMESFFEIQKQEQYHIRKGHLKKLGNLR